MAPHHLPLRRAIELFKGQRALARRLTEETGRRVSQARVWGWLNDVKSFPPEMCAPLERITDGKVRRAELRPDLFSDPA